MSAWVVDELCFDGGAEGPVFDGAGGLHGEFEFQCPAFINIGDTIKIDTRTGAYVERVKV